MSYDNGLSAYQRLREEPFELSLTDIVMPEMDGIELARRAAELDPDIKIMFIPAFPRSRSIQIRTRPSTPKCCRSRSICANWSAKCRRCWRPNNTFHGYALCNSSVPFCARLRIAYLLKYQVNTIWFCKIALAMAAHAAVQGQGEPYYNLNMDAWL